MSSGVKLPDISSRGDTGSRHVHSNNRNYIIPSKVKGMNIPKTETSEKILESEKLKRPFEKLSTRL